MVVHFGNAFLFETHFLNSVFSNLINNKMSDRRLSKTLSWLLRHSALKAGMNMTDDGFFDVDQVLNYKTLKEFTVGDVERVVRENDKQRFTLRTCSATGRLQIRANQGHSFEVPCLELIPILACEEAPVVIHGTYFRKWNIIRQEGLKRMNRTHIHFAPGEPGEREVISGMRNSCQVYIYIDLNEALQDGLKFFRSTNNVILCSGNEDGIIEPKYFKKVIEVSSGRKIQ